MNTKKLISSGISSQKTFSEGMKVKPHIAVVNTVASSISQLQMGLTIFNIKDSSQADDIRNAVDVLILGKSVVLGIPMPKVKCLTSIYSGNVRQIEQFSALLYANMETESDVKHKQFEYPTCDGIDWVGEAGQYLLMDVITQSKGVVTLTQNISSSITPSIVNGLYFIREAAKEKGVWIVMLLSSSEGRELVNLDAICDDYIEVGRCDPDPGCDMAFSFDCVALRKHNRFGVGKTMCNVDISDGEIHHHYMPFIASDLETRAMWMMRKEGMTLDAIGKHVGLDKSNVLRRLKGLPNPPNFKVDTAWIKCYFDATTGDEDEDEDEVRDVDKMDVW